MAATRQQDGNQEVAIRRHRRRGHSRPPSQSWRTFLAKHSQAIWAADFFVVQTLTFQTLYVLFFISHGSRQLIHFEVTDHPTAAWVWRQLIEATPQTSLPDPLPRSGLGCRPQPAHLMAQHQESADADSGASRERGTLGEDRPP
jgi:hypothetical protein